MMDILICAFVVWAFTGVNASCGGITETVLSVMLVRNPESIRGHLVFQHLGWTMTATVCWICLLQQISGDSWIARSRTGYFAIMVMGLLLTWQSRLESCQDGLLSGTHGGTSTMMDILIFFCPMLL